MGNIFLILRIFPEMLSYSGDRHLVRHRIIGIILKVPYEHTPK